MADAEDTSLVGETPPGFEGGPERLVETSGEAAGVAEGSALLLAARIIGNAGFFVGVLILARALSVPHRGAFAFATTAAQVLARVAGFGVMEATTIFSSKEPEQRGQLLTNAYLVACGCTTVVAVTFCAGLVLSHQSHHLGLDDTRLALLVLGALVAAISGAGYAFLTGCGRWRGQSIVSAAAPWLYGLLLLATWRGAVLSVDVSLVIWVAMYAFMAVAVVGASAKVAALRRPSFTLLKRSLRFGIRAWVGSITSLLNYRTDQLLMGFLATQAALGVYAVAVNTSETLLILPSAGATALLPFLARSELVSHAERTLRAFRVLSVSSLALMVVAGVSGPLLVPLVFGSNYRAAVAPFLWLIAGTVGFVATTVFGNALLSTSSPGLASLAPVASLTAGTALDLVLIPSLGATGAAIAAFVAFTVGGLTAFFAYRTRVPFGYELLVPRRSDLDLTRSGIAHVYRATTRRH